MSRPHGDVGAISTPALVAAVVAVAVVVGLIAGAVWGQSGSHGPSPAPTSASPTATSATPEPTSPSPTPEPTSATPEPTSATPTPAPTVSPTGSAPPAPATTSTVVPGWRLGSWRITSTGGTLGVDTTARNTGTAAASAGFVLYVYVGGQLIATTFATVTDVPAGASVPVHFAGSDPWKPGQKVLLLQLA